MLPVFYAASCAILYCAAPPHSTYVKCSIFWCMIVDVFTYPVLCCPAWHKCGMLWCDGPALLVQPFTVLPPAYTAPMLNATCFVAMGVGVLGVVFLCYAAPSRLNAACCSAMCTFTVLHLLHRG